MDFYKLIKPFLFSIDPELAHNFIINMAQNYPSGANLFKQQHVDSRYSLKVSGVDWSFPIGLAAGLDKNAQCFRFFEKLYFGAIEVGTVTPKPQKGNPRPRMFRYIEEESIRNCMGFNNEGMKSLLDHAKTYQNRQKALGINIGKNKLTTNDKAIDDYITLLENCRGHGDYFVINISSPNTVGLRDLQNESFLKELKSEIDKLNIKAPVFVKIDPDQDDEVRKILVETIIRTGFSGLIATNTTRREDLGIGGMSGKILTEKAAKVRFNILEILKGVDDFEFIGVGGVSSFEDVLAFWKEGGRAMQVYTAFVFQGPRLLLDIKRGIDREMRRYCVENLEDLLSELRR